MQTHQEALDAKFERLAAATPRTVIKWRQDDEIKNGESRHVAYVSSQFVRQRLDESFPGDWQLSQEPIPGSWCDKHGVVQCVLKATITVMGLSRSSIGLGDDPKTADSDSMKRAGVRWGIASDLYSFPAVYVKVSNGRPIEDPWTAYERAIARKTLTADNTAPAETNSEKAEAKSDVKPAQKKLGITAPQRCPICNSGMWNNSWVRKPGGADYRCKDKSCPGAITLTAAERSVLMAVSPAEAKQAIEEGLEPSLVDLQDDLPF